MNEIRQAEIVDALRIAELNSQLGYPSSKEHVERRLAGIFPRDEHLVLVAIGEKGEVVGYIHLEERYLVECDPILEVAALVVDENVRGRGIGKQLMTKAKDVAESKGLNIMLRTNIKRDAAHRFYEGLGYVRTGTSYKYEGPRR